MTDFLKSNPIALRHCLLYEYLRKKPVDKTIYIFCVMVGFDVIKEEECHIWFNRFKQGIFDINKDKEPITDMRDVLRNDKYALRACILYESIKYKLNECVHSNLWPKRNSSEYYKMFSIYKHFCNVVGEDVMEYPEFEFWFYRFNNEEFDLNYERDKDNNTYELMDMPVDVMENIVEYLDIFDRIKLAKASRSLQTFVEDQKLFHPTLKLTVANGVANVSFGKSVNIKYIGNYAGCKKIFENRVTLVQGVFYWKQALLDFKDILKNPKLHLDTLHIESEFYDEHVSNDLEDAFKFIHFLNVKNLIIKEYSSNLLVKTLPLLKPGYLTTINIGCQNLRYSMEKVFEMEQWKQAKYFKLNGICFIWPLQHLYHFKEFTVTLWQLPLENIRQMKEILFKSPYFEKCSLIPYCDIDMSIVAQEFGVAFREDPYIYHYPIVNSTDYFEVKVYPFRFEVGRKKR